MPSEDPRRLLALSYASPAARDGLAALLDLDAMLGGILRSTSEPLVGQMRLTWWHEALSRLDTVPPPAEPVLQGLAAHVLPRGVSGAELATIVEGWEALLDEDLAARVTLDLYAGRGVRLFAAMARVAGAVTADPVAPAGRGWALADLATHVSDPEVADRARELALPALAVARAARWSRGGRPLAALARTAGYDVAGGQGRRAGASHVLGLLRLRLTGR